MAYQPTYKKQPVPQMLMATLDTLAANVTRFGPVYGRTVVAATEANHIMKFSRACVLRNATIILGVAPGGAQTYTFTLRKNGGATAITIQIVGAAIVGQDITHTVSFVPGDTVDWQVVGSVTAAGSSAAVCIEMSEK